MVAGGGAANIGMAKFSDSALGRMGLIVIVIYLSPQLYHIKIF